MRVAVVGNIAVGKSTLITQLSRHWGVKAEGEPHIDTSGTGERLFSALSTAPKRWMLAFQTWIAAQRARAQTRGGLMERCLQEDMIFARVARQRVKLLATTET